MIDSPCDEMLMCGLQRFHELVLAGPLRLDQRLLGLCDLVHDAISCFLQLVVGETLHRGVPHRDRDVRLVVVVPITPLPNGIGPTLSTSACGDTSWCRE